MALVETPSAGIVVGVATSTARVGTCGAVPVPLSETVCGEPAASLVMVRVPVREPEAVGVKLIAIPQLVPTATVPHWLLAAKSPLAETESTDRAAVPELVTVADCVGLVVPIWRAAKVSDAGLTVS